MNTTSAQIDLWRSSPSEHQRLEFKEAKTQFDNHKLYKYCVALANEGGGHLLLGVADKPPRSVVGTSAFSNPVEMAARLFQAVGFRVDIEEVLHPDGRVLVFHIPSRPRGTAYHLDGAYLMRAGEELLPMSEDQLRRIFAEGEPDWLSQPALTGRTSPCVGASNCPKRRPSLFPASSAMRSRRAKSSWPIRTRPLCATAAICPKAFAKSPSD